MPLHWSRIVPRLGKVRLSPMNDASKVKSRAAGSSSAAKERDRGREAGSGQVRSRSLAIGRVYASAADAAHLP